MHYHCEIILPETDDIESAIASVLAPFNENGRNDYCPDHHAFWDFYAIGGRWSGANPGDICTLGDAMSVKCSRVVFASPAFDINSKAWCGDMEAVFMLAEDAWNGVNHMPVTWDGTTGSARHSWNEKLEHYAEAYRATHTPRDDWLAVTVDYHS